MSPTYKRWYDHDPLLLEVIDLLRNYQTELRAQAEIFLKKIEERVSKETIDKFYAMAKPVNANNRWYDKDPVISKTVEILRIVPPEAQRICAQNFIKTLKEMGIDYQSPNEQRKDDNPESFKVRLDSYHNETEPLIEYYKNKKLLAEVDALQEINQVYNAVEKVIKG